MKKTLVAAILGLAAAASIQAQGFIQLYNYNNATPATGINNNVITYGINSGGTLGAAVSGGYTVGMYYAIGDVTASVNAAFTSAIDVPAGMTLATGAGSTALLGGDGFPAGTYGNTASYGGAGFPPGTQAVNFLVTIVVVAYNGTGYTSLDTTARGHSQAFTMTANTFATPNQTGSFQNPFSVVAVPEPSTFALAGLGLASLLIFRRRK